MTTTAYRLHLGFNWYGATLGSVWGSSTDYDSSTGLYFLQNALALADSKNVAASFMNFKTDDTLSIVIWDLSSSSDWQKAQPAHFTLYLSFSYLDNPTTIDPTTLFSGVSEHMSSVNGQYCLQFSPGFKSHSTKISPWGAAQGNSITREQLTFASSIQCKLSFLLQVKTTSTKFFVSDPEISVSSS